MKKFVRFKFTDSLNNVSYLTVNKETREARLSTDAGAPLGLGYCTNEPMLFRFALEDANGSGGIKTAVKKFCQFGSRKIVELT